MPDTMSKFKKPVTRFLEIDTLRSNTTYRVSPYIQNEYSYQYMSINRINDVNTLPSPQNITKIDSLYTIFDIDVIKKISETKSSDLNKLKEYKNIIFNHEFDTVNNEGIVFDNSENTFFAEKIPTFFIK